MSLSTSDLQGAVRFYRALLDVEPAKSFGEYALFVADDPALELAVNASTDIAVDRGVHFGILVADCAGVDAAAERLESIGVATDVEREQTCCFANQTKVWANDPDGRRWEVYAVHAEADDESGSEPSCCAERARNACCAA